MNVFTRDDGLTLRVIEGFRGRVLSAPRVSVQPKPSWTEEDYQASADKKVRHARQLLGEFARWGGVLDGVRVLEVGCGAGIDCMIMTAHGAREAVGIDVRLPLFEASEAGERTRKLVRQVLAKLGIEDGNDEALGRLAKHLSIMDVTAMTFPDDSFDFLMSRAAMEHIMPVEQAISEMARVVRPGGLIFHTLDPYYWLKGCHKSGLVDIPWAHARLSPEEFRRFVTESEGDAQAAKRSQHLKTLNQFTPAQWRKIIERSSLEILDWKEERSGLAEMLLAEYPEVEESLIAGIRQSDLACSQVKVWLRKNDNGGLDVDPS